MPINAKRPKIVLSFEKNIGKLYQTLYGYFSNEFIADITFNLTYYCDDEEERSKNEEIFEILKTNSIISIAPPNDIIKREKYVYENTLQENITGLANSSNHCYINAVVQLFRCMPELFKDISYNEDTPSDIIDFFNNFYTRNDMQSCRSVTGYTGRQNDSDEIIKKISGLYEKFVVNSEEKLKYINLITITKL